MPADETSTAKPPLDRAHDLAAAGRPQDALAELRPEVDKPDADPQALSLAGRLLLDKGEPLRALPLLDRCVSTDPEALAARRALSHALAAVARTAGQSSPPAERMRLLAAAVSEVHALEGRRQEQLEDLKRDLLTALLDLQTEVNRTTRPTDPVRGGIARLLVQLAPANPTMRANLSPTLASSETKAGLSDFMPHMEPGALGRKLFVACFPKSGSTFLLSLLSTLSGLPHIPLCYTFGQNEQDLYLPYLQTYAGTDAVVQQHCRATEANVHLMQGFGITPVILVRNLFDTLVSLHDYYDAGLFIESFLRHWPGLSADDRRACIIDMVAPWYITFYASWWRVTVRNELRVTWLAYETLIERPEAALKDLCRFWGINADSAMIAQTVNAVTNAGDTRLNKGVAGRGASFFTEAEKERIRGLTRYHPNVDFSAIGL
ncbi:hypothetical protein C882_2311 [Caenispirillum salinarum AK4]|uniref:Sulfotransferase domain-containing protein n=1 Tax=Caenispirillum salinarum AK4 TaxID=1238182 RepID=K9H7F9_9PROT|nr:sulfotransferase domain-containing protein [Caenispirillum salinarum]EKV26538.1 hypothetical protein C882_2311 [Caenispirillum salinarum AK4]